jgi:hypothetical protein
VAPGRGAVLAGETSGAPGIDAPARGGHALLVPDDEPLSMPVAPEGSVVQGARQLSAHEVSPEESEPVYELVRGLFARPQDPDGLLIAPVPAGLERVYDEVCAYFAGLGDVMQTDWSATTAAAADSRDSTAVEQQTSEGVVIDLRTITHLTDDYVIDELLDMDDLLDLEDLWSYA